MDKQATAADKAPGRWKFIVGGALIIAAIVYLIVTSTSANAQYYLTVEELNQRRSELVGKDIRVSGAVIGTTILDDPQNQTLIFRIAHIPGDQDEIDRMGGMALVLHNASLDESLPSINIVYHGVRPDLLKNEAQAIMTGTLNADGTFLADELLLKCPTKYEEAVPTTSTSP